jgi:NADH-quinone oxidoreductase subunit L
MEGPTPVSALIHAATMVAAGVYLVTRIYPMLTPDALLIVAYIGAITAFLGATIAIAQNDIKRVLAYSTISQLGYMMLGLGAGAYTAGFFHLTTHAAFKACLFLCSGSVIHAVHTQDMREMGGLKSKMPITYWTCLLSTLAISGVPFTSGFLSKDAILAGVLEFGAFEHPLHLLLPLIGFGGAGITAFYMFRLVFMTFHGQPRDHHAYDHAHESPKVMTVPLVVLATLTAWFFYSLNPFSAEGWVSHLVQKPVSVAVPSGIVEHASEVTHGHGVAHYLAMLLSLIVAGLGIYLSYLTYYAGRVSAADWASRHPVLYRTLLNKYYFDELYSATVIRFTLALRSFLGWFDLTVIDGLVNLSARLTALVSDWDGKFDNFVVDGAVNGTAFVVTWSGGKMRRIQTGRIQNYVILALTGIVIIFLIRAF